MANKPLKSLNLKPIDVHPIKVKPIKVQPIGGKKKSSHSGGFGGFLHSVNEVGTKINHPIAALSEGIVKLPIYTAQGVGTMMGAAAYDIAHPSKDNHFTRDILGGAASYMGGYYGGQHFNEKTGKFEGKRHLGLGTLKNIYHDPTQVVLDAATIATLGGAAAAKLGEAGMLGAKGRALSTPGKLTYDIGNGEAVVRTSSHNPWTRTMQNYRHKVFNHILEDLPLAGDKWSQANRGTSLEARRIGRRVNVQTEKVLRPYEDATRGLSAAEKVAVSLKHQLGDTTTETMPEGVLKGRLQKASEDLSWAEQHGTHRVDGTQGQPISEFEIAKLRKDVETAKADLDAVSGSGAHQTPATYRANLDEWIKEDEARLAAATTSGEKRYWAKTLKDHQRMDKWLQKADRIWDTIDTNPKLQNALEKMRNLNEVSEDVILAHGLIDPAALSERPYLMTRVLTGAKALKNEEVLTAKLAENPGYQGLEKALNETMPPELAKALLAGYVQSVRNVFAAHNIPELEQILQIDHAFANLEAHVHQGQFLNPVDFEDALYQQHREPYPFPEQRERAPNDEEGNSTVKPTSINPEAMVAPQGTVYVKGAWFYSKLMEAVTTLKSEKIATQELKGLGKKFAIKEEELRWSGFNNFVAEAEKAGVRSVNKADLVQYLTDNFVRLDENVKSYKEQGKIDRGEAPETPGYPSAPSYAESRYTLEGGGHADANYREIQINLPESEYARAFYPSSSHWPQPNNIGHVRMTDRWVDDVESGVLEETQSDLHQEVERNARRARKQGRELPNKGYKQDLDLVPEYNDLLAEYNAQVEETAKATAEARAATEDAVEVYDYDGPSLDLLQRRLNDALHAKQEGRVFVLVNEGLESAKRRWADNEKYYRENYPHRTVSPFQYDPYDSSYRVFSVDAQGKRHPLETATRTRYHDDAMRQLRGYTEMAEITPYQHAALDKALTKVRESASKQEALHTRLNEIRRSIQQGGSDLPFKDNWSDLFVNRALAETIADGKRRFAWTTGDVQARRNEHGRFIKEMKVTPRREHRLDPENAPDRSEEFEQQARDYAANTVAEMDDADVVMNVTGDRLQWIRDEPEDYTGTVPHIDESDLPQESDFEIEMTDENGEGVGEYEVDNDAYEKAMDDWRKEQQANIDEWISEIRDQHEESVYESELQYLQEQGDNSYDNGYGNTDNGYDVEHTDLYGQTSHDVIPHGIARVDDDGREISYLEHQLGPENAQRVMDHHDVNGTADLELNMEEHSPLVFSGSGQGGASKAIGSGHYYNSKIRGIVAKIAKKYGVSPQLGKIARSSTEEPVFKNRVSYDSGNSEAFTITDKAGETKHFATIQDAINFQADEFGDTPRIRVIKGPKSRFHERDPYAPFGPESPDKYYVEWYDFPEGIKYTERQHTRDRYNDRVEHGQPTDINWGVDVMGPFEDKYDMVNGVRRTLEDIDYTASRAARLGAEGTFMHYIDIPDEMVKDFEEKGFPLWQRAGTDPEGPIRGAYEYLGGGKGRITVAAGSVDADTWIHEGAHHLRQLIAGSPFEDRFATAAGATREGDTWVWSRDAEEKFAGMMEAYMREQRGPVGKWYRDNHYAGGNFTGDGRFRLDDLTPGVRAGFKALITNRAKLEGKSWWGGSDLGSLRKALADTPPGFFPHVGSTLREKRGISTVRRGSRPLTPPDFVRFNTGWRVRYSRWLPDPAVLRDHHLKLMSYVRAKEMQKFAIRISDPVDHDLTLKDGYHYIIEENKDRPTRADIEHGLMDGELQDAIASTDLDTYIEKNISTQDKDRAKQWEAEGHTIRQISDRQYNTLFGDFKPASEFMRRFYDDPTNVWRTLTLNYRPAWVINNFVGQTLLYFIHHGGRGAFKAYIQAFKEEKPFSTKDTSPRTSATRQELEKTEYELTGKKPSDFDTRAEYDRFIQETFLDLTMRDPKTGATSISFGADNPFPNAPWQKNPPAGAKNVALMKRIHELRQDLSKEEGTGHWLKGFDDDPTKGTPVAPPKLVSGSKMPDELRFSGMFRNESPITHAQLAPMRAMEHKLRNRITEFNARLSDNVPRNAAYKMSLRKFSKMQGELGDMAKLVRDGKLDINAPEVRELHDAIIENVLDTLIDFSNLSPFERKYMRRAFPFYSWIKGIMKSTAILGFHHPGRLLALYMLSVQGEQVSKEMYGDAAGVLAGFVPYSGQKGKRVQTGLSTAGLNPFATVGQTAGMAQSVFKGGNEKDNPFLQMNPLLQGIIETATKQDLFTKRSLGDSQLEAALKTFGYSTPEVTLIKDLLNPQDGKKKMTPQRRRDLILRFAGLPQTQKNIPAAKSVAAKIKAGK